jgi:hypothetical protein
MSGVEVAYIYAAAAIATTVVTVASAQAQAKDQRTMADYQARQAEQRAGQERAMSQRKAMEERRQSRLAISRAQAVAGGGSTDDGVLDLTGRIAGEGEYNALNAIYEGEESALGRGMQAQAMRMKGDSAQRAANYQSAGSVFSSATSMYGKYANGGFTGSGYGAWKDSPMSDTIYSNRGLGD